MRSRVYATAGRLSVRLSHPASRRTLLGLLLKAQWPDFDQVLHGSATLSAEHGLVLQVK